MKWQMHSRNHIDQPKPPSCNVSFTRRQEIATRCVRTAHYRSYAAGYNFIHERGSAPSRSRYCGTPRSLSPDGFRSPDPPDFLYSTCVFVPVAPWQSGRTRGVARCPCAGDCYVRKKPSQAKSVDNLNYISHHNPREPVKPTPAFCPAAPRLDSSEWMGASTRPSATLR